MGNVGKQATLSCDPRALLRASMFNSSQLQQNIEVRPLRNRLRQHQGHVVKQLLGSRPIIHAAIDFG